MWLISHLISVAPVAGCKMSAAGDNDGRTGLAILLATNRV